MCASSTLSITHCRPLLSTIWFALCRAPPHLTPLCWVSIKTGLHGQQAVHSSSDLFSVFVMRTVSVLANSFHFQLSAFQPARGTGTLATCWAIFCDAMLKIPTLYHISPFFTKPYKFLFSFPKLNFANVYRTQNGVWNKSFISTWWTLYYIKHFLYLFIYCPYTFLLHLSHVYK